MTHQVRNTFIFGEKNFSIIGGTGEGLFKPYNFSLKFESKSTACRAGYYCSYEVLKNRNEELHLYLRKVTFSSLKKIADIDSYPRLFHEYICRELEYEFVYSGMEVLVPFTGELVGDRGFFNRRGLRQPDPTEDWYEPDETFYASFTNGQLVKYGTEGTAEFNKLCSDAYMSGDFKNTYDLPSNWREGNFDTESKIVLGEKILSGQLSPKVALMDNPCFADSEALFDELIIPAVRLRFDEALKNQKTVNVDEWFKRKT
jgi:hypothetical protein